MGLRLVIGRSGSGKTAFCQKEIAKKQEEGADRLIYIVPEQFSLEAERELLQWTKGGGILGAQVLSFRRLAFYVFAKSGAESRAILEDCGKTMALRKIVGGMMGALTYYKKSAERQGFMEKLSDTIAEFFHYGISPEKLLALSGEAPEESAMKSKLSDLARIYGAYLEFLKQSYLTSEEALSILADKIPGAPLLTGTQVFLDGFYGFTPQEFQVIEKLLLEAAEVTVTLPVDAWSFGRKDLAMWDGFFEPAETAKMLLALAENGKAPVRETVVLKQPVRFRTEGMRALERDFFSFRPKGQACGKDIRVFCAVNKYDEICRAAGQIRRMIQEDGYRFRDIAVVSGGLPEYQQMLQGIFREYQIPFFIDAKRDALSHPLMEAARTSIAIFVHDFSYESVFRYLKTGLCGIDREDVDLLENYVLAYGIKGYQWKKEIWEYGFTANPDLERQQALMERKARVMGPLLRFYDGIRPEKQYNVRELTTRLYHLLEEIGTVRTLEGWISSMKEQNQVETAFEHQQAYRILCQTLDKIVEVFGQENMTLLEYGQVLDAGFGSTDMGVIPPGLDRVIVGNLERTKLPQIRALFVLGVNDGILPSQKEEAGLFSELEREQMAKNGAELSHNGKRKAFEEQFLIYAGLTKPAEQLFISYAKSDMNGRQLKPSVLIGKLFRIFPDLKPEALDGGAPYYAESALFHEMGVQVREYVERGEMGRRLPEMIEACSSKEERKQRAQALIQMAVDGNEEKPLKKESVEKLIPNTFMTSVSRLERFVSCPFAYFLEYGLEAKKRPVFKLNTPDLGILFHQVLELFSRRVMEAGESFNTISEEDAERLVETAVEEVAPALNNEILFSTAGYQYLVKRLLRIAKRTVGTLLYQAKKGRFTPFGFEIQFGKQKGLPPLCILLSDGRTMLLDGTIDRVDLYEENGVRYIKIIDYKSGAKTFQLQEVYYGLQLQLLLYLDAYLEGGQEDMETIPGGVFYFRVTDPMLAAGGGVTVEEAEQMLLKELKMSGLVLAEDAVIQAMDDSFVGEGGTLAPVVSDIIPVGVSTKGGFRKSASVASREEYEKVVKLARKRAQEIGDGIAAGTVTVMPYRSKRFTPCTYCEYHAVCCFDPVNQPIRTLPPLSDETVWEKVKKEL